MNFGAIAAGESVFLDANILVYHFGPHPTFGTACNQLVQRVENQELLGFTSASVLSEAAHHLMTLEAASLFGWPSKIVQRLKQNPANLQQLIRFRQALEEIQKLGIQVLTIPASLVITAAAISQQTGLLSNDALIVGVMQLNGLTNLASNDPDFDRVPGITRFEPN